MVQWLYCAGRCGHATHTRARAGLRRALLDEAPRRVRSWRRQRRHCAKLVHYDELYPHERLTVQLLAKGNGARVDTGRPATRPRWAARVDRQSRGLHPERIHAPEWLRRGRVPPRAAPHCQWSQPGYARMLICDADGQPITVHVRLRERSGAGADPTMRVCTNCSRHLICRHTRDVRIEMTGDRFHPFVCGHGRSLKPDTREPW